jgi:hypothetical protein
MSDSRCTLHAQKRAGYRNPGARFCAAAPQRGEVLDFEHDPALDTATLPTPPPGRHFTVANLT